MNRLHTDMHDEKKCQRFQDSQVNMKMNESIEKSIVCDSNVVAGDRSWGDQTWIGDFPTYDPTNPCTPTILPIPDVLPYTPTHFPVIGEVITSTLCHSRWCVDVKHDRIIASIDIPGCKVEDVDVELTTGTLSVKAKRREGSVLTQSTYIGSDYDVDTASGELEDGVLTVTVMKLLNQVTKRVSIRKK